MNEISLGAVIAAIIAGLVSLLGLIIGKEQKVSEFRQAWINDLRQCLVGYLVSINAICDSINIKKSKDPITNDVLLDNYKLLNEASHGIELRINDNEADSKNLLESMRNFETIAKSNSTFTPEKIKEAETAYIAAAKRLLKFEWNRVKQGEKIFVRTKRIVITFIFIMVTILLSLLTFKYIRNSETTKSTQGNAVQIYNEIVCPTKYDPGVLLEFGSKLERELSNQACYPK